MPRDASAPKIQLVASPKAESLLQSENAWPPPHILFVLDAIAATLGGGERVVFRLAKLLPARGYRVSIMTLSLDPQSPALVDPPCPVYLLPLQRTWDLRAFRAAAALRRFLKQQRVDLVQTFFESSDLWAGSVAKTIPGMRLIWSRRDMGILRDRKHEIAYRLLRRMPDRVLAVSEQVRQHGIEVDGIDPDRVETLYNGIDIPEEVPDRPDFSAKSGPVFVSVGNVRPVKGFDVLLEAAIAVLAQYPAAVFKIAGEVLDAAHHAAMVDRAAQAGAADRFLFLGNVTDVRSLLRSADIFVLPSRSEGFSNAIIEAMAASLPVVATRVGGNGEAVVEAKTGLLVPPDDPDALATAMLQLVQEHQLAHNLGAAGRQRAAELFTTEAMLTHQCRVYDIALQRR